MSQARQGLALFDLDGTLIHQDSLSVWIGLLRGRFGMAADLLRSAPAMLADDEPSAEDWRGRIKSRFLRRSLSGVSLADAESAASMLPRAVRFNRAMTDRLAWHRDQGHHTVIVTGAPGLYVPALLVDHPYDDLIATELEVDASGRLTGRMAAANNVRAAKGRRVEAYIAEHGPFAESWGYGNRPHDEAMLAQVDHAVFV